MSGSVRSALPQGADEVAVEDLVQRRRDERVTLIERARDFARALSDDLGIRAVVVFGSVARGDFNRWSDVDVLVVADRLPTRFLDRLDAVGRPPPRVQAIAWTPQEWRRRRERADPIVVEAERSGVWLIGSSALLAS